MYSNGSGGDHWEVVAGHQPYATTKDLVNVRDDATLLPPGVRVLREAATETERARLATGDGWTLCAVHWPRTKTAMVGVTAATAELGAEIMALATDGMTDPPLPSDEAVSMGFWYASSHGPQRNPRPIETSEPVRGERELSWCACTDAELYLVEFP